MSTASPAEVPPLSIPRTVLAAVVVLAATMAGRVAGMLGVGLALGRIRLDALDEAAERTDGLLMCAGILGAAAAGGSVLWAILRKREPRHYLALERPVPRHVLLGIGASLALVVLFDTARWATSGEIIPAAWLDIFRTAGSVPLLLLAFVVVAPIFEECFFRGFLYRGIAASRVGPAGAIAITSVLFMLAHGPEDLIGAVDPLASAVLLGVIRQRTGSITTGIAMHAVGNLQAIVTALVLSAG
jgi:uncharacterized protein